MTPKPLALLAVRMHYISIGEGAALSSAFRSHCNNALLAAMPILARVSVANVLAALPAC